MSGPDAIRGINFQHACALETALHLLTETVADSIQVEGSEDVIDITLIDADSRRLASRQAKTRKEPATWPDGELASVVQGWLDVREEDERFEFVTDGQLGARAHLPKICRALNKEQPLSEANQRQLEKYGLQDDEGALKHVEFTTRHGLVGDVLTRAERQLAFLHEVSGRNLTLDEVETHTNRLFRKLSLAAGSDTLEDRTLRKETIAKVIGLRLEELDGHSWEAGLERVWRDKAAAASGLVSRLLEVADLTSDALRHVGRVVKHDGQAVSLDDVLRHSPTGIVGPAGVGKSSALDFLAARAAEEGVLPIVYRPTRYQKGALLADLRGLAARACGLILNRGGFRAVAETGRLAVLVDGVSERPSTELDDLLEDLSDFRRSFPNVILTVAGRRGSGLNAIARTLFELVPFDFEQRNELAASLVPDRDPGVTSSRVVERLGVLAKNALFYVMGLSLMATRGELPQTRFEILAEFATALEERAGVRDTDLLQTVLASSAMALVDGGWWEQTRYWWLDSLAKELDRCRAGSRFDVGDVTAEQILERAEQIGWLVERAPGYRGFVHDTFRDYFAVLDLVRSDRAPTMLRREDRELVLLWAEKALRPHSFDLRVMAENPPLAADLARSTMPREEQFEPTQLGELVRVALLTVGQCVREAFGLDDGCSLGVQCTDRAVIIGLRNEGDDVKLDERTIDDFDARVWLELASHFDNLAATVVIVRDLALEYLGGQYRTWNPPAVPREQKALLEAVGRHFQHHLDSLFHLTNQVFPALAPDVVPVDRGFEAWVDESQAVSRSIWEEEHPLAYRTRPQQVVLRTGAPQSHKDFGHTSAESFLDASPKAEAHSTLAGEIAKLLRIHDA